MSPKILKWERETESFETTMNERVNIEQRLLGLCGESHEESSGQSLTWISEFDSGTFKALLNVLC